MEIRMSQLLNEIQKHADKRRAPREWLTLGIILGSSAVILWTMFGTETGWPLVYKKEVAGSSTFFFGLWMCVTAYGLSEVYFILLSEMKYQDDIIENLVQHLDSANDRERAHQANKKPQD